MFSTGYSIGMLTESVYSIKPASKGAFPLWKSLLDNTAERSLPLQADSQQIAVCLKI